ncbi:MAG: hypothetical protein MJ061_04765, partial [Mailhella sp.]|nr:hypothetical protein [Mailhella sp.]
MRARTLALLYVVSFVAGIGNPMALPCFPHIMREFCLSALELGMMITVFAVPALFAVPLSGLISDRIG